MTKSGVAARHLRTLLEVGAVGGLSDGQLLERFATRHGEGAEAAFAALVERHGPMVLGVCRRTLADPRDAEDAFQATFLVLVKKARTVRVDDSLGRWLYGVACRVAARARARAARRQAREGEALVDRADLDFDSGSEADRLDLRRVLDEELGRLPEKYRAPVVLCYLEGLTHETAAARLGWPVGTVRGRLSRARERLRTRLSRRGLTPTAGLWAVPGTPPLGVSEALAERTIRAAFQYATARGAAGGISTAVAVLAEGALKTMVLSQLKLSASAWLAVAATSLAASVFLAASDPQPTRPGQPAAPPAILAQDQESATQKEAIRTAAEALGPGHWSADKALPVRYYNHKRGYWMYAKEMNRSEEGKQLRFRPFAIVWKSRDRRASKTITSDQAIVDLDQPLDPAGKSGSPSMKVIHARLEGDVRICDGKGTPDPADDLVIGPLPSAEFDEPSLQIRSRSEVVIQARGMRITGFDLLIKLRPDDEHAPASRAGGFDAKAVYLQKSVHVVLDDAGRSGILPGKAEVGPGPAPGKDDEERTPLELRCTGAMRVELPEPMKASLVGHPAPPSPATIDFSGDVVVRQGRPGRTPDQSDQLDCDELRLTLLPKPQAAGSSARGAGTELALREVLATGHAVWLQLRGQGITARCIELIHKKLAPDRADETLLRGDGKTKVWVEKVETAADGPDKGKPQSISTIRTTDATIFENGPVGEHAMIEARGPGSYETRPSRDQAAERKATWEGLLTMRVERDAQGRPTKVVTVTGHPELTGPGPVHLGADKLIIRLNAKAE